MNKKQQFNNHEKKLQQICNVCWTTYQLIENHSRLKNNQSQHCLAHCFEQWNKLLHQHYEERVLVQIAKQEKQREESEDHE